MYNCNMLWQLSQLRKFFNCSVSLGIKNGFIIFLSYKIIIPKYPVFSEALQPVVRFSWDVWDPAGPPNVLCWPSVSLPTPPPPRFTCLIWGSELYIYTECWGTITQSTVSLSVCLVTHWSSLHHHLHHQHNPPSLSYPEKECFNPVNNNHLPRELTLYAQDLPTFVLA